MVFNLIEWKNKTVATYHDQMRGIYFKVFLSEDGARYWLEVTKFLRPVDPEIYYLSEGDIVWRITRGFGSMKEAKDVAEGVFLGATAERGLGARGVFVGKAGGV